MILTDTGPLVALLDADDKHFAACVAAAKRLHAPMDLADATLLTVAESRGMQEVFTLDTDFYIYRLSNGAALTVIR